MSGQAHSGGSRHRLPLIDELRAVAALSVLVGHIWLYGWRIPQSRPLSVFERFFNIEAFGVPLFFAISGFLLYGQFARAHQAGRTVNVRSFWRNRALRILPGYWVALTVLAIYPGLDDFRLKTAPFDYTLTHAWVPGMQRSGIAPAWTLCAEVGFYALLPLIALGIAWLGRRGSRDRQGLLKAQLTMAGALWLGSLAFDLLLAARPGPIDKAAYLQYSLLGTFHWFALGMVLASLNAYRLGMTNLVRRPAVWPWWAGAVALQLVYAALFTNPTGGARVAGVFLQGAIAFCVLAPAALLPRASVAHSPLSSPKLAWFGLISYGIYIWQLPVIDKLADVILDDRTTENLILFVGASIAAVIGLGAASYYLVEKRFLRLKDGIVAPARAQAAAAARHEPLVEAGDLEPAPDLARSR